MVKIVVGPEAASKISKVLLSADTISRQVNDMSDDTELNLSEKLFLARISLLD
jgi:hypothetical protein